MSSAETLWSHDQENGLGRALILIPAMFLRPWPFIQSKGSSKTTALGGGGGGPARGGPAGRKVTIRRVPFHTTTMTLCYRFAAVGGSGHNTPYHQRWTAAIQSKK
jgi:hypothetical protein